MKKSRLWLLLVLIVGLFTGLEIKVEAASNVFISSSNITANYMETVEVPISINNNLGLMGFGFEVTYDEDYLEPLSVEKTSRIDNGNFDDSIGTKYANPFRVVWAGTNEWCDNGKVFTLKFNAKKSGSTVIRVNSMKDDIYDGNYNKIYIDEIVINVNITCSHTYDGQVEKEATCTSKGLRVYTCSVCGDVYEEYIDEIAHDYTTTTITPTCTKTGLKTYKCKACGYSYSEVINARGHQYKSVVTEPTCIAKGYTTHTCSVCGDSYISDYKNMVAHKYISTIKTEATCMSEGVRTCTCSVCGTQYDEKIDKVAHNFIIDTTDATCTKAGLKTYKCKVCGYSYSEVVDAIGHQYKSVVTESTCIAKGYTTHTCSVCGDSYISDYKNMVAHKYTSTIKEEATCMSEGIRTYTCSVCGTQYDEKIDKIEHNYIIKTIAPECDKKGYNLNTCSMCNDSYIDNYTEATGHKIVKDDYKAPTCIETGLTEGSRCSVCEKIITVQQVIPKLEHAYKNEIVKPTCMEDGHTIYTCIYCGDSYTEDVVNAIGHNYISFITKPATEKEKGIETYQCKNCGDTYVKEIPVLKSTIINGNPMNNNATNFEEPTDNLTQQKIIKPQKTKIAKVKKIRGRKIRLSWKRVSSISGYQIQYAINNKFTKSVKLKNVKVTSKNFTLKKLKKKTYYIRIRTYQIIDGTKSYSEWSKKKKIKVK